MKKRGYAVLFSLIVTVFLTVSLLPSASFAAEISSQMESSLEFCVDLRTGSDEDMVGNYTKTAESDDAVYVEDETLKTKVGVFGEDCLALIYESENKPLAGYDLAEGITLEAYVYITPDVVQNMTFVETAGSSLHLQMYNNETDQSVGFRCGDTPASGESGESGDSGYMMRNAYADKVLETGKWVHLLGISDGETNRFYINGQLEVSIDRNQSLLKRVNNNNDKKLCIGESIFGDMFGATAVQGRIAFVKMYKAAADDSDIAALYENASGAPSQITTSQPTATVEPTEEPTPEPTPTASPKPTEASTPTQAPAAGGMDTTLLTVIIVCGVVVLAAILVLVIVLVKKSKAGGEAADGESSAPSEENRTEGTEVQENAAEETAGTESEEASETSETTEEKKDEE